MMSVHLSAWCRIDRCQSLNSDSAQRNPTTLFGCDSLVRRRGSSLIPCWLE